MTFNASFRSAAIALGALVLLQARCNDPQQFIPYVPVDFSVNVNLPAYIDLSVPSGHVLVSGGSQGIILYRYTLDEFVALHQEPIVRFRSEPLPRSWLTTCAP